MYGDPLRLALPGYTVRPATAEDEAACNALCVRVHGHDRAGEVGPAIAKGKAQVVERFGRVTAYTTGIGYFSHSIAETNDDLEALIRRIAGVRPAGVPRAAVQPGAVPLVPRPWVAGVLRHEPHDDGHVPGAARASTSHRSARFQSAAGRPSVPPAVPGSRSGDAARSTIAASRARGFPAGGRNDEGSIGIGPNPTPRAHRLAIGKLPGRAHRRQRRRITVVSPARRESPRADRRPPPGDRWGRSIEADDTARSARHALMPAD